jgi:hypothetical protein
MEVVFVIFSLGEFQRGTLDPFHVQVRGNHHLVSLTGECEQSHFDHHHKLLPFFLVQLDQERGEILLKPREENSRSNAKVGYKNNHQPINLLLETVILDGSRVDDRPQRSCG